MKKCSFCLIWSFLLLLSQPVPGQGIKLGSGIYLVSTGSAYLVIDNGGLSATGDLIDSSGTIVFTGNAIISNTTLGGSGITRMNHVKMNKSAGGLRLSGNIEVMGTLELISGDSIHLNNNQINLGLTGSLSGETNLKRITGLSGGYIQATRVLNAPATANPGNLGLEITSTANMGTTIIRRGHTQQGGASIYRYFDIIPTLNTGLDATVGFYYFVAELANVLEVNLGLFESGNGGITWTGRGQNGINTGTNMLTKNNLSQLNRITLASVSGPLSVELIYFKSKLQLNQVKLEWATAGEINNDRFEIERSAYDGGYQKIGMIPGNGTSSFNTYYSFIDPSPKYGMNFYRLKQVDRDGKFNYSNITSVNNLTFLQPVSLYPNPARARISCSLSSPEEKIYKIELRDINGVRLDMKTQLCQKGVNIIEWEVSALPGGTYYLCFPAGDLRCVTFIKN